MAPDLAQFEQQFGSEVKVIEINSDIKEDPQYQTYKSYKKSNGIPDTVLLRDGKEIGHQKGQMSFQQLVQMLEEAKKLK